MSVLVDTSALFALLARDDRAHPAAAARWPDLIDAAGLITHNYVVVETTSLLAARLGIEAVRDLRDRVLPLIGVVWIDEQAHDTAFVSLLASGRRDVSIVDHVSFALMRELGIERAFAYDRHFREEGFDLVG